MIRETAQINDLTTKMRERTAVLLEMKSRHLDFKWLQEFGLQQLMDSCDRIAACLPTASVFRDAFQRELIPTRKPVLLCACKVYAAQQTCCADEPTERPVGALPGESIGYHLLTCGQSDVGTGV